jgi:hypothetical protein
MISISSLLKRANHALALIKNGSQPSQSTFLEAAKKTFTPEIKSGTATGNEWDDYRVAICDEFKQYPMGFLRQPVISRTVHPNQQELAREYLSEMAKDPFACKNILSRLHDVPIGDPYLCEFFPTASPMSVQHVYYQLLMHRYLDLFIPTANLNHILEFGGGYGNFCRLACCFGYSGRYVIVDLPEMHSIQEHFLTHALPKRVAEQSVEFRSLQDENILPSNEPSLFMATFSLNETPMQVRDEVEKLYEHFDYLFFAYNRAFGEVDNQAYFDGLRERLSERFELNLVKDEYRSVWFLFGKRKHNDFFKAVNL